MIQKSVFANLLRVITPEEINLMTKSFDGNERELLTDLVDLDLINFSDDVDESGRENKAKILELRPKAKSDQASHEDKTNISVNNTSSEFVCGDKCLDLLQSHADYCLENEDNIFGKKRIASKEKAENYESTDFILQQLNQTHINNEKLKKVNVWKVYSQNSSREVDVSEKKSKSFSSSSTKGNLINKRQA